MTDFWICRLSSHFQDQTKHWSSRRFIVPYHGKVRANLRGTSAVTPELYNPLGSGMVLMSHMKGSSLICATLKSHRKASTNTEGTRFESFGAQLPTRRIDRGIYTH